MNNTLANLNPALFQHGYIDKKPLQREKRLADRSKVPLSIAFFRFDRQKSAQIGTINEFLTLLQNNMRETDTVSNLGENVIGLLLPDTNAQGMQECMKRIVNRYHNPPFSIITEYYPAQISNKLTPENQDPSDNLLPESYFFEQLRRENRLADRSKAPLSISLFRFGRRKGAETGTINDFFMTKPLQKNLLSKSWFLKQLRREKRLADRSKAPLSIALFRFYRQKDTEIGTINNFLTLLQNSIRETDMVGYLGENVIGLLLSDTDTQGTQELMKKIVSRCHNPSFSIITGTYPDQIFNNLAAENQNPPDFNPLFLDHSIESNRFKYLLKRGLDIVGALVGMILFSPLMLITAIAIKRTSPGPVIFKQIRLGKEGIPFIFYKFRSMYSDMDDKIHREYITHLIKGNLEEINQGDHKKPLYKIKSDPRVTQVGRLIRKTSIDELPQLFNVLKGEMSLVGPRPPLPYEAEKYQSWHLRRILEVKPGITGLWQVGGRSETSFDDMVRLDLRYSRSWSLMLDFKILLKTVKIVLQLTGAV